MVAEANEVLSVLILRDCTVRKIVGFCNCWNCTLGTCYDTFLKCVYCCDVMNDVVENYGARLHVKSFANIIDNGCTLGELSQGIPVVPLWSILYDIRVICSKVHYDNDTCPC